MPVTRPQIDLTGSWAFYPDVGNAGLAAVSNRPGKILVPGAWQAQGYGTPGGTIPSANIGPGTSPAEYLRHNLMARCLYVRKVIVPADWRGQRIFLCVRRAYRYTDLSVNGKRVGEYEGFCSPFEFEVTDAIRFGGTNQLELGVDNRPRPGRDTLGTANLYGNWGGIGGKVYLEARAPAWIDDVFALPQVRASAVELRVTLKTVQPAFPSSLSLRSEVRPWSGTGEIRPAVGEKSVTLSVTEAGQTVVLPVSIANGRLWTPEDPFLYTATVKLVQNGQVVDALDVRFGLRELRAEGRKLFLNGKPLYLSGYGDDATEPITGMLPADKGLYEKRLRSMRSLGFDFVRHHSCVPHDEYFEAADEVGMLVQPEAGLAYTGFWRTGRRLFEQEWPHIIKAFRNHPSVWAWCMGNELFLGEFPATSPAAGECSREEILELVAKAYREARELDPTRLVHASDGGALHEFTDVFSSGGGERFGPKPFLLHEYGTYCCSLPDFSLIPRLNGVMRPLTYERAERYVREHHLEEVYPELRRSSLLMRAEAQKHYMESARLAGSNQGYSFWLGIDFPESPEGCWDEGILNELWEPKPFLTNSLINYNGSTVLLTPVSLEHRSFYADEEKLVPLRLWHYGAEAIQNARLVWRVVEGTTSLQSGTKEGIHCAPGENVSLCEVGIKGLKSNVPRFVTLHVELATGTQKTAENRWDFYGYPRLAQSEAIPGVYSEAGPVPGACELRPGQDLPENIRLLITRELKRERHLALFQAGKAAILLLGNGGFKEHRAGYFLNQYGAGYGGIIEQHPVFAEILHEGRIHPGLYQLAAGGGLLNAEEMPAPLRDGAVVWGLQLTGWISPVKNLTKVLHWSEVITDKELHLVLCNLDLLSSKPESRYVLGRTIDYLLNARPCALTKRCDSAELGVLLR